MSTSTIAALMIALLLGVLAFAMHYQLQHPRQIVRTGTVSVVSQRAGGGTATLKTRNVSINDVVFQEVELPNGTWIGCEGDCARAAREAGEEFWVKQMQDKR